MGQARARAQCADRAALHRRHRHRVQPEFRPPRAALTAYRAPLDSTAVGADHPGVRSLRPGAQPAGKLGLGGVRQSEIQQFRLFARMEDGSLTDMGLTAAQHVTDELCGAFGGRWAGFAVSVSPMGARFKIIADITLKPNREGGAALPVKIIPIVMAYGTDKFVDHYPLAVIAAQATREQVETTVVQPFR